MSDFWMLLLNALMLSSIVMLGAWRVARRVNNYSLVDAIWAFSFALLTAGFALEGTGWWVRKFVIALMVGFWSLRLGLFLFRRIRSHYPAEDSRYEELRKNYAPYEARRFFFFFQYQAWSVVLLVVPFLEICLNPSEEWSVFEIIGGLIWLISVLGESLADAQMNRFKKNPLNKGKVCQEGLWKYSRHPNYFFESCLWWGYFIFALGTPGAAYVVYAPLIILFLLLKVTGVPLAEAQSLKSRGQEYRDYQRRTSVFIPWPPKSI